MKVIYVLFLMLVTGLAQASEEQQVVKLGLNLNITKKCDSRAPFCMINVVEVFTSIEVPLYFQSDGAESDSLPCYGGWFPTCTKIYRGIWSKVVEKDGVRSIAIVSINKEISSDQDTGVENILYAIEGEILGDNGLEAKLRLTTQDLKNLNDITLEGKEYDLQDVKYQASLSIGPERTLNMPIPCLPGDTSCGGDNVTTKNRINLIMGSLK